MRVWNPKNPTLRTCKTLLTVSINSSIEAIVSGPLQYPALAVGFQIIAEVRQYQEQELLSSPFVYR